ncbi:hypothetical protein MO867_17790 [Microbulbifer sp. OS29]|uniref:Uncharacterized protein n=1 Tax=Microbulbifer okhotskensis TaxID=2926617 RepID=A0A9X2ERR7_9GAMM|nr:hypothetical protein [Microbulbifer okhotskensis]MCO1336185.1 hypothetical protein [Microbulbifer okhotskensis]
MNIEAIKSLASEMAGDLNQNKMEPYAESLMSVISGLDKPERQANALRTIESVCHVKAYGDLFLETLPGYEWLDKVSKLRHLCCEQQNQKE